MTPSRTTRWLDMLKRDVRSPDLRLLVIALIVAVTAVTSVSFFTDRVDRAMRSQASALFGSDLLIQSTRPISDDYEKRAQAANLATARTVEFPSVALAGDNSLLTQIKAVSDAYPLRGLPETSLSLAEPGTPTEGIPGINEAWVETNVLHQLGVNVGDNINIGLLTFKISRILTFAADNGGSPFQLAPRVIIPLAQLNDTGLLTPASRATFRFLVAGQPEAVNAFQEEISPLLSDSEALQNADQGRPEITSALDRASRFMGLASILTITLSGAAIAMAAFSFTRKEAHNVAILKSLGSTKKRLYLDNLKRFLAIIVITTAVGSLLGFLTQFLLAELLSSLVEVKLPSAGFKPIISGFITASLTLGGFALPILLSLAKTPPMQIFRAELQSAGLKAWVSMVSILVSLLLFLIWHADDTKLAINVFFAVLAALLLMLGLSRLITLMLKKLPTHAGSGWQMGIRNIGRYPNRSALLLVSFGVAVLTLSLLGHVRQDLMSAWQKSIPESAPNHFLINIQAHELNDLEQFLKQRKIEDFTLYPMIRGRLIAINERQVSADDYQEPRAKRLVSREFNLSSTDQLPNANTVVAGDWNGTLDNHQLSVESGIAETLGFTIGDRLTFDVAGQKFVREIGNLRQVNWDSMQPNFFVIVPPATVGDLPATHITSMHVPSKDALFTTDLVKQFPGVTVLDVRAILKQVRNIIDQASRAVQYVFSFTLLAGITVLLAAVQTQRQERKQDIAILKTLGAKHPLITQSVVAEFSTIGAIAGVMGSFFAVLAGWVMANQVFDLPYSTSFSPLLLSIVGSAILLALLGYQVVASLIRTGPNELLRQQ